MAAPQVKPIVFIVTALDRIHAWLFSLLWATLLALAAAVGRSYTIQWISYCQLALFWYPIMIADGLYLYCPQQQQHQSGTQHLNKQLCSHAAQTRRLAASVVVAAVELVVILVMIILAVQSSSHNAIAALYADHVDRFVVLIVTQAVLALVSTSHVVCQWAFGAYPGRMIHARLE